VGDFWKCFVPLFVAVDAVGVLPLFLVLTEDLDARGVRRVIVQSVVTATAIALLFVFAGSALLRFLGITVADFMVAGGLLLFAISLNDLLAGEKRTRQVDPASLGAVPLGIPLITGPAVLTTCLLLAQTHGKGVTALAAALNIALAGGLLRCAPALVRRLGRTGLRSVSKIASLLLASIAVMLVRRGAVEIARAAAGTGGP
jgi:multiple antibiotic resistance protein